MHKYVLDIQRCCSFGIDFFVTGYKDCRLGAIVVGNGEDGVVSLRLG